MRNNAIDGGSKNTGWAEWGIDEESDVNDVELFGIRQIHLLARYLLKEVLRMMQKMRLKIKEKTLKVLMVL
ncbi:MAG: hypothetical protein E6786_04270 [Finegoldia magna]|nr:hypothetical protein [Finegoldia magna]DAM88883.1 MAG TPA: hypothetical protein [Caudoviricetes sp.]